MVDFFPPDHPDVKHGKIGVLLVNLGTPDGYDSVSMRRYLKEFLSDRRVIEAPRLLWWFVLNGIILRTRPKKSGLLYESIWDNDRNESPLRTYTRSQSDLLSSRFLDDDRIIIDWAMRYGTPDISSRLDSLFSSGCDRIIIFPLYPQYSATTTATVLDSVFGSLSRMRWVPSLRTVPPFFDDSGYIDALASSVQSHLSNLDFEPERIIASYHGIPRSYFDKGDPYHCHCVKTTRLLGERLGFSPDFLVTTFQSRFGREEWLRPYTDETVRGLADSGIERLCVITPGFYSDCLETLQEIALEVRDEFLECGGKRYSHIPCLNASDTSIDLLELLLRRELSGWI